MKGELDHLYIKKVLSGDKSAFRYFIKMYQEMAISIAISIVKHDYKAKEVTQNAFVQAYKSLGSFKKEAQFSTWFYRIVVNEALQFLRKQKANRTMDVLVEEQQGHLFLKTTNNAIDKMELMDKKLEIQRSLQLMKPKERLILELFYLQEYSIAEIEEITGFSNSNIKVLLHRARKSFESFFKPSN